MNSSLKTIILGLGNTILTDDGVGIYVARRIKEMLTTSPLLCLPRALRQAQGTAKSRGKEGTGEIDYLSTPPPPSPYKGERERTTNDERRTTNNEQRTTNDERRTTIKEASVGGFNFIDILSGYDRAVIIDAIHTKSGHPGEFYEVDINCLKPSARISSLHGIDLATACDMARKMGIDFPKDIRIFVMEVEDEFSFGEKCTPAVEASITKMAKEVLKCVSA